MSEPQDAVRLLRPNPRDDYLHAPLPCARDRRISALLPDVGTEGDIGRISAQIERLDETVLVVYAQRMAVLAVRESETAHLRAGLRAACLASTVDDRRDVVVVLALLWRSAELLHRAPEQEFAAVAESAGRYGEALRAFVARPPQYRGLAAMKYAERGEGRTFEYVCQW